MAQGFRKSKVLEGLRCCWAKEHSAGDEGNSCNSCPFQKEGSICREELLNAAWHIASNSDQAYMVEIGFDPYGEEIPICPQCEGYLGKGYRYCPQCGVALDWDDYFESGEYDDFAIHDDYSECSHA